MSRDCVVRPCDFAAQYLISSLTIQSNRSIQVSGFRFGHCKSQLRPSLIFTIVSRFPGPFPICPQSFLPILSSLSELSSDPLRAYLEPTFPRVPSLYRSLSKHIRMCNNSSNINKPVVLPLSATQSAWLTLIRQTV